MRVLYILNSTLPTGGATKAIMGIVPLLQEKGVKPIFLMPDQEGIYRTLIEQGYDTISIPFKMSIYPDMKNKKDLITFLPKLACRIIINILALYKIRKLVKILKPDIIHTNTSVVSLGRMAAKSIGVPHIQHIREYGVKEFSIIYFPSWRFVHKQIRNHNTFNICITKDIQRHHGLNQSNSDVI
jgi:UDP-N-acetylglucosamine:LPS N-acetylglucosamine transferase